MSEFSMFYKVFGCIHACILHVLSVRLTRVVRSYPRVSSLNYSITQTCDVHHKFSNVQNGYSGTLSFLINLDFARSVQEEKICKNYLGYDHLLSMERPPEVAFLLFALKYDVVSKKCTFESFCCCEKSEYVFAHQITVELEVLLNHTIYAFRILLVKA